jgi:hypothetical protein
MGFFSKKKEEPKKDGHIAMGLDCPICKKNSFMVYVTVYLNINNKWGMMDSLTDPSTYLDKNTGVCMNCGIVSFGELLYNPGNSEKSLETYGKLLKVIGECHFIFDKIIQSNPIADKRLVLFQKAMEEYFNVLMLNEKQFYNITRPDKLLLKSMNYAAEKINKK